MKYRATVDRTERAIFEFTDADIEDDDAPADAALELLSVDFAGPDPYDEVDETVFIEVETAEGWKPYE